MKNKWLDLCVEIISEKINYNWGDIVSMKEFDVLAPHAYTIVGYAYSNEESSLLPYNKLVLLCNVLGYGFRCNGKYSISLECYIKSISMQNSNLCQYSIYRSTLYYNIAWLYDNLNDINSAIKWYQKDLMICEALYGKEAVSTAHTYNSLGVVYMKAQNYKKAMNFLKRAQYIFRLYDDKCEIDLAAVYNNIANIYAKRNLYEQALHWYYKDIAISEKIIGKNHPDIAISYNNIGVTLYNMGDYFNALKWYEKALKIRCIFLNKDHPDLNLSINNAKKAYKKISEQRSSFNDWLRDVMKH